MGGSLTKFWWGIDRGSASGQNSVVLQEAVYLSQLLSLRKIKTQDTYPHYREIP